MLFRVTGGRVSREEVLAVLQSCRCWEKGANLMAISHGQQLKAVSVIGQNPLPVPSHDELYDKRCQDPTFSRVGSFVDIRRWPSVESWENFEEERGKLATWLGVLHRVS